MADGRQRHPKALNDSKPYLHAGSHAALGSSVWFPSVGQIEPGTDHRIQPLGRMELSETGNGTLLPGAWRETEVEIFMMSEKRSRVRVRGI